MGFTDKLAQLLNERNIQKKDFLARYGYRPNAFSEWRYGTTKSYMKHISEMADDLNVSVDYLLDKQQNADLVEYAIIGTVKAGYDGEAIEINTGETLCLPTQFLNGRDKNDYFILQVSGDSMYPQFLDGDKVMILRCDSVDTETIACVLYNGNEATIKKVHYRKGCDWLDLIPINPNYQTKRIQGADLDACKIIGKVVKLIRDV